MHNLIDMDPHLFYELDAGYALLKQRIVARSEVTLGEAIPVSCMFDVNWLLLGTQRIGYFFRSQFKVMSGGGYLVTFMESKRGTATAAETLLKIKDELVLFHFPNRGTLAISPVIGEELKHIFEEQ
jgi:hypothetical protein